MVRKTVMERVLPKCTECGDCLIWNGATNGRGLPGLKGKSARRAMWEETRGAIPVGKVVKVTCGNSLCLAHLALTDRSEAAQRANASASSKAKRSAVMSSLFQAKLGKIDMATARAIRASDKNCTEQARELGISRTLVSRVRRGKAWKDLANPFAGLMA